MATATVDPSICDLQNYLHTESLPLIDLRHLSQSELLSLSFCSSSLHRLRTDTAEVSTPKDRPFQRQPLDEENSQIISLLKSLFGSDSSSIENNNEHYHKLVSVPVIYNDYMRLPSTITSESQNVSIGICDSSQGGVERLEVNHLISIRTAESSSKKRKRGRPRKNENVNFDNNDNSELFENKTIAVMCNNMEVEGMKKEEKVSKNGAVVDFVALANMEDPYGEELRRRTEGMQLKAELLGFLEGFEGEWGRYLICFFFFLLLFGQNEVDPNGQQFVSCKEASSYLHSFSGLHDVSQLNSGHMDGRNKLTDKITLSISADHTCKDGKSENDFISYKALPVTCRSIETGGCPVEVQMRNKYKCHKCTVAFDKQDDLLQHLLSHQQTPKRLRCGTSTNEDVIIKNGKYECQFCLKLFEERHRFNGHLGNHIKDYLKRLDASSGKTTGKSNEPGLVNIPPGGGKIQTLIEMDRDSDAITFNTRTSGDINSTIPYCELKAITSVEIHCGEQDRVFNNSNDGAGKMKEDTDAMSAENRVSSEPALLNGDVHRSSDETDVTKCPTNGTNDLVRKDKSFKNGLVAGGARDLTCIGHNNLNQVSPCLIEELNQERDSNSGLLAPNAKENTSNDDISKDRHCSSPIDNMVIDGWDTNGKGEPITGCCNSHAAMGENAAANLREQRTSEGCYVEDTEAGILNFNVVETMLEKGSKGGLTGIENNMNSVCTDMSNERRFDDMVKSGTNELTSVCRGNNTVLADDNVTSNEQAGSVIPFLNQHTHLVENNITRTPKCIIREPCRGKESEDSPITISGSEQLFDFESNVIKVSNGTIDVANHDQTMVSAIANWRSLSRARDFGCGSSDNEQSHGVKDIVNGLSCTTVEEDNQQEVKISCNGELHIASDDNCTCNEQYADVGTGTVHQIGTVDELKQKMDSVESVICPSGSEPVWSVEKNLQTGFIGSALEEPKVENSENPRKDDSGIGFSAHPGPDESDVISEFMWKNDEESNLLSDFADTSCQPVQTSGFPPPYDLVSDKGESEFFAEKFGSTSGFEGLKWGGMDNMECNLLTSQVSSHSDESNVGKYDAVIPQGIDSSIWRAKEDLPFLPKNSSRHHVSAVCVWCGREICQEVLKSEGQTSTLGFMCAECTAKLSGQLNE
ncbi:METHYL-CPG-BINDING DOMAIN-CONTAINING PROTEIN 8 [Salix viminalis]|uniref:METHYL-CPG-BINDING DOMAIN-CONTAINING PROTEIN 8 n=1 Tax=Salix viminalis TaxID=40686 RepID=A0A9Q0UI46_SALVM|nr:METHYL-CPG-BINDING DOMAIN-CONTAINING PROTEIN 8 [Salix viminalis]